MALNIKQPKFPEPDGPLTVFVPLRVGGVKYERPHAEVLTDGMTMLADVANAEGVTLTGKPRFRRVEIAATGDLFLMGEQDYV